jgi:hypothetical protein
VAFGAIRSTVDFGVAESYFFGRLDARDPGSDDDDIESIPIEDADRFHVAVGAAHIPLVCSQLIFGD